MAQEGQVHTGELMASLESYVASLGIIVRTGAEVLHVASDKVEVRDSQRGSFEVRAGKVVVCTNAFARDLIQAEVEPWSWTGIHYQANPGLKIQRKLARG